MIAVDNDALKDICKKCDCTGFAPALNYAYNVGATTVTITDASVFGAGDTFKRVNVEIYDDFGGSVKGTIAAAAGNTGALSVATLSPVKGLGIKATVSSNGGCVSDGSANNIVASGSLGDFDKDFTSSETGNVTAPPAI